MFDVIFLLKLLLLISFSFCYLNFGHDGGMFIFQAEYDSLSENDDLKSFLFNPLFIAVYLGQIMVFISLFTTSKLWLMVTGIFLLGFIEVIALLLGPITGSLGTVLSTIPFFIIAILLFSKRNIV